MSILITELSGELSNSFVDLVYADSHFENHYSAIKRDGWAALSDEAKEAALFDAALDIDTLCFTDEEILTAIPQLDPITLTYRNVTDGVVKFLATQRLQFPRNRDIHSAGDRFIPTEVMKAQCEQAYYRTVLDESELISQRKGITRDTVSLDGITTSQAFTGDGDQFSPIAIGYLRKFFRPRRRRMDRG
jgi:hypothetical protein